VRLPGSASPRQNQNAGQTALELAGGGIIPDMLCMLDGVDGIERLHR
jgi:hypothetical protein